MDPYNNTILNIRLNLNITEVGKNVKENLKTKIIGLVNNRCIEDGIVKISSIKILTYSAGAVDGDKIRFNVVFECLVCNPCEGMVLDATVKTITKAGIHATVEDDEGNSPITVFVARDHYQGDKQFNTITEGQAILVRVIGSRFELNDQYICVIANLDTYSGSDKAGAT